MLVLTFVGDPAALSQRCHGHDESFGKQGRNDEYNAEKMNVCWEGTTNVWV